MESHEEVSKEPGKSKFVTAGGRAVAVDWRRLKEVEAFFESCETQAHSLPPLCRDSAVGADALPVAPTGSSIDDQCISSGAPAIVGQAESEPLGKFMTAGGRAVSMDTVHLQKIQALFDSCETEGSKVSCGRDRSVGTAPPTICFADDDVSDPDDPSTQHDTSAMLCRAGGEPVGKFMTAGGRVVAVDAGHVSKVQRLFQSSEAEAIHLLSNVQDDQVAVQQPVLQLPRAEDQGCQTPDCKDLLQILNPPSLTHTESSLHNGPASNDSTTHGQHNQNGVFASCESVGKFVASEGRANSATGQLHESLALFQLREPRSRDHSASRDPWQRHQPSPDRRDHPGHTGEVSDADDPHVQHDTSAMLCRAGGEPVGKFMTAGGRAVSVDAGHVSKVQRLFQSSEAVLELPVVGITKPPPQTAPEGSEQAVGGKATASQALCSQNPRVDRENAHSGKLEPASTASLREEAEAEAQSPICRSRRPQDALHFSEVDGFDGHSGMGSIGKRLLANDLLASHREDPEEHVPVTTDISLIDWVAGKAPPSIVQGFAEECCAESIKISSRYEDRWLRNHLAQLALLSLRSMAAVSRDLKSICKRLGKRARAEIAGRRSAIFQICTGLAPADQHMVLMCTAPWSATMPEWTNAGSGSGKHQRLAYSHEDAWIELSDGWYFIKASVDAELHDRVRRHQLRPGRLLHVCMASAVDFPVDGSDPLQLPETTRLHLRECGCRPASAKRNLGFQRGWFPPAKINQLHRGLELIPSLDVVVLRILPPVVRHWRKVHEDSSSYCLEERSISQEQRLWEEHVQHVESNQVPEMDPGKLQLQVVVIDTQALSHAHPGRAWWTFVALLAIPGTHFIEQDLLKPLDRLRMSSLRKPACDTALGPSRIFCNRNARLQHQRGAECSAIGPLLQSPFGRGPPLFASPQVAPADHFRGFLCDLIGVAVQASKLRRTTSGRQTCVLYLLTPSLNICQIFVQQPSSKCDVKHAPRLLDVQRFWNELAEAAFAAAHQARLPTPLAVQNVAFEQSPSSDVAYFSGKALQIIVSSSPRDAQLRHILDLSFVSPADFLSARSRCQANLA
ncbi:Brca2 [Symbiodinium sp. CCMP2456]|nr:Brca2 [Symbiodinium sp. CCMP2456]